ncbi:hypothetical protein [Bacillus thuringiensis]|uniref:DUF5983 domain-containing protein n=1 Tax=Bacillus thuringiensis TaxID=1428 RepID=A0A9X7GFZ5_BACTU|nr:hypothetical protein [Bacillus thuringiensis]PFV35749.1 hypothetical protein COK99_01630 [Bacillus thuringiensis]
MLPITKVLELSTKHICEDTVALLDNILTSQIAAYQKEEFGWFIYVSSEENENTNIPDDLSTIISFARLNNCSWVMLDRDCDTIDELPIFDW